MIRVLLAAVHVPAVVHLSTALCSVVAGILVPIVTSLVTKLKAPDWIKQMVFASLTVIGGAVSAAIGQNGNLGLESVLAGIAGTWLSGLASHYGYNNVIPAIGKLIDNVLPNVGLGPKVPPPPAPAGPTG